MRPDAPKAGFVDSLLGRTACVQGKTAGGRKGAGHVKRLDHGFGLWSFRNLRARSSPADFACSEVSSGLA